MPTPIRVLVDAVAFDARLFDGPTAQAIAAALPIEDVGRTFGQSFYVETPVTAEIPEDSTDAVQIGDIAYWPAALALAFFYGPTPESAPDSDRPVAASEVEVVGELLAPEGLRALESFDRVRIERT